MSSSRPGTLSWVTTTTVETTIYLNSNNSQGDFFLCVILRTSQCLPVFNVTQRTATPVVAIKGFELDHQ